MTTQNQKRRRFLHFKNQLRSQFKLTLRHRKGGFFEIKSSHGRLVWRGKGWMALVAFLKQCDIPGPHGINGGCHCCR